MRTLNLLLLLTYALLAPFSHAGPPAQSGPNVVRIDLDNWWFYDDGDLAVFHGLDIPATCSDPELMPVLETWHFKFINIPADESVSVAQVKGDDIDTQMYSADLLVFDENDNLDLWETCTNWLTNPELYGYPLAAGKVDAVFTGNNLAGPLATNPRRSTFHMSAHGVLDTYGPGGEVTGQVGFSGGFNCSFKGAFTPEACKYSIRLH